jgi:hAT family C-terminal dimerisation region
MYCTFLLFAIASMRVVFAPRPPYPELSPIPPELLNEHVVPSRRNTKSKDKDGGAPSEVAPDEDPAVLDKEIEKTSTSNLRRDRNLAMRLINAEAVESGGRERSFGEIDTSTLYIASLEEVLSLVRSRAPDVVLNGRHEVDNSPGRPSFFSMVVMNSSATEDASPIGSEIATYLDKCPCSDIADTAGWWQRNSSIFPILSRLARMVFTKPTSTAAVERLFSSVGHMQKGDRSNIAILTMERKQFYKEHLRRRSLPHGYGKGEIGIPVTAVNLEAWMRKTFDKGENGDAPTEKTVAAPPRVASNNESGAGPSHGGIPNPPPPLFTVDDDSD